MIFLNSVETGKRCVWEVCTAPGQYDGWKHLVFFHVLYGLLEMNAYTGMSNIFKYMKLFSCSINVCKA